jgi:hypothetical protein
MLLQFVRGLWGVVLLLAPHMVLGRVGRPSRGVVAAARVLGARHVIEALIVGRRRAPPRWIVIVDVVHGITMVATGSRSRRLRREAGVSAAMSGLLACWSAVERRSSASGPALT